MAVPWGQSSLPSLLFSLFLSYWEGQRAGVKSPKNLGEAWPWGL